MNARLRLLNPFVALLLIVGLPLASLAQTPFSGTPIPLPGTFEAEDFDNGGEGIAYHDNVAGNNGGQYRPNENVDIIVSTDSAGGGYVVQNFETGEWLLYTVNVASTGYYDIAIRASNNWNSTVAFHVEIDGVDVTGNVLVPMTGAWNNFQWVTKRSNVQLSAGQHRLKLVSNQQYFNVNQIRLTAAQTSTPFSGTPIALPATFEAEDFDNGGQDVAYHDNVAGNAGGQYRPNESVDIRLSGTRNVVYNFETSEWLQYTVNVPSNASYDIGILAANNLSPGAFHVEIDGIDVTGSVSVALTGSWDTFQWFSKTGVNLTAGEHKLRLVSNQQYFDVDQIRVIASGGGGGGGTPPGMLFWSGFEAGTTLPPVSDSDCYSNGCFQQITGTDSATGFTWPIRLSGTGTTNFQQIMDPGNSGVVPSSSTVGTYQHNALQTVTGHNGTQTQALYQEISRTICSGTASMDNQSLCPSPPYGWSTQDTFRITPTVDTTDLYMSYWLKLQPDLLDKMHAGDAWRVVFEIKTVDHPDVGPDFRYGISVHAYNGLPLWWRVTADRYYPDRGVFWQTDIDSNVFPVPTGEWFKVEVYWHRSAGADGRFLAAINGVVLDDHRGPNMGAENAMMDRIMITNLYSGSAYPIYQWVDDLQLWSSFPTAAAGDPWYNPPYAPH